MTTWTGYIDKADLEARFDARDVAQYSTDDNTDIPDEAVIALACLAASDRFDTRVKVRKDVPLSNPDPVVLDIVSVFAMVWLARRRGGNVSQVLGDREKTADLQVDQIVAGAIVLTDPDVERASVRGLKPSFGHAHHHHHGGD